LRLARQTVAIAGPVLERAFGAGAGRLSTRPFLMAPHRYLDPSCDSVVAFASITPTGRPVWETSLCANVPSIAAEWEHRGARSLADDLGPEFSRWIGIGLPIDSATDEMWANVRIDVVTSAAHAAHECYAGNVAQCALALGVTGGEDPAMQCYAADERRELVSALGSDLGRGRTEQF